MGRAVSPRSERRTRVRRIEQQAETQASSMRRVVYPTQSTEIVYQVPPGVVSRRDVEALGTPRFVRGASSKTWASWNALPPRGPRRRAGAWLDAVPLASPDASPRPTPAPEAFEVAATTWCAWSVEARAWLWAVTSWRKVPGAMRAEGVDAEAARRILEVAAQYGLAGLEEAPC